MENNSDELELIELLKKVWNGRKQIIIISFIFVLFGVLFALISPVIYTSNTTFINSQTESKQSGLSGVASLVGINLGGLSSGSEIPPSMYPQIGESIEFKRTLLNSYIDEKKEITLEGFLADYNSVEKPLSKNDSKLFVSEYENTLFDIIKGVVSIGVIKKMALLQFRPTCRIVNMRQTHVLTQERYYKKLLLITELKVLNKNSNTVKSNSL